MADFCTETYIVRRLKSTQYEVTKFIDGRPKESYYVDFYPNGPNCNCRGFRYTPGEDHKHVRLVRKAQEVTLEVGHSLIALWFEPTDEDVNNIAYKELANVNDLRGDVSVYSRTG